MRVGDDLFFAPGVRFPDVDLDSATLGEQVRARLGGFYLVPARVCISEGHAFAAGVLLVSVIDFFAGLHHPAGELAERIVGRDFRRFVRDELPSFASGDLNERLYDEFRNGLTHEARIKNAGEFSLDYPQTVRLAGGRMCINPVYLLKEVESAINRRLDRIANSPEERATLAQRLHVLFAKEFGIVGHGRQAV